MSTEGDKAIVELAVFREFVLAAGLDVAHDSERKGNATLGEPDVLCTLNGKPVGFELAESCAPEFAAEASAATRSPTGVSDAVWGDDVSDVTLRKKLNKRYSVECPVHLLFYARGFTGLPDSVIIDRLRPVLAAGLGPFRSLWFFGERAQQVAGDDV